MHPFDTLLQIDTMLTEWLVSAAAITDVQRVDMTRVLALRASLDRQLNALIAFRLQMAVASLPDERTRLADAAAAMKAVTSSIESVQSVISAAGIAVTVAARFASVVMTVVP